MLNNIFKLKTGKAIGAMQGAAYGDALGWPNERFTKSKGSKQQEGRLHELKKWIRHSGGRFFPHEEIIEAGEYSDDTQLILCLSRSLMFNEVWWDHFTKVELPFWTLYERGGGGATKRAAEAWINGHTPWNSKSNIKDIKRYFEAGGNGVAMRILPHVIKYVDQNSFSSIAINVFRDGIATHGHPRALLGALAYSYALWLSFKKETNLAYGELINDLLKNIEEWSHLPSESLLPFEWWEQAKIALNDYSKIWEATREELKNYLKISQDEITKGALIIDDEVLEKLQCFNNQINGAGTVAAIAAIYLASRYAADPINGVIKAAFAFGSDTDTIASMTGGLLGCISGVDWLSSVKNSIQDYPYIEKTALQLLENKQPFIIHSETIRRVKIKSWEDDIFKKFDLATIQLLDTRKAVIHFLPDKIGRSGNYKIECRKLISTDGQTIYLNKISKGNFSILQNPVQNRSNIIEQEKLNFGTKLFVESMEKSLFLYCEILGLKIKKKSKDTVVFDKGLVLTHIDYLKQFTSERIKSLLYIEVNEIEKKYNQVIEAKLNIVSPLSNWAQSKRRFFRCNDIDGNIVEIFSEE